MKLQHIEIRNFKGITELSVSPNGHNVYAIGGNGVGKTSFIDAVFGVLAGKSPAQPTKKGARNGEIRLNLGDILVESTFDSKKEKMMLTVSSPDGGSRYDAPRTMLNELVGIVDFDVAGFMALTPRKQAEWLKKVLGIDTADLDAQYAKTFEERAESNKQIKWLENNAKPYDATATELVDVTQLHNKRMALTTANLTRKNKEQESERLGREIAADSERLERLKREVEELDGTLTAKVRNQHDIDAWLDENPHQKDDAVYAEIEAAEKRNEAVKLATEQAAHRGEIKKEKRKNENLVMALAAIEEEKAARISAVAMPVPGLTFTEDGLLLDGLPFESSQINTARQIIAGLQLCGALHKSVKIARFDGSLLDGQSLAEVEEWAAKAGIQLFIELVERGASDGLQIVISEDKS